MLSKISITVTRKGMENRHRAYNKYIGVHKDTNQEITKEEYDALSSRKRENYRKVRYLDVTDDKGNVMNRVYEDDAGYMKTFINRDIAIGDPINMRYATIIGNARFESEKPTSPETSPKQAAHTVATTVPLLAHSPPPTATTSMPPLSPICSLHNSDNGYVTSPRTIKYRYA